MIKKSPLSALTPLWVPGLVTLLLSGCGTDQPVSEPQRLVAVEEFQLHDQRVVVAYPGTLEPRYQNMLAFQVGGRVGQRHVEVGDRVDADTLIATLDPRDYDLALAELQNLRAAAQSDHKLAQRELKRLNKLHQDGFVGDSQLDAAINHESASAARLKALVAKQSETRNRVEYTELKAQRSGLITALFAEAGAVLAAGQPVAQLAWLDSWEFVTAIPENRIGELDVGQSVALQFWVLESEKLTGQIREIAPAADPASRSYRVKIILDSVPEQLKLGMSGTVQLVFNQQTVGTLPTSALLGHSANDSDLEVGKNSDTNSEILVVDINSLLTSLRQVTTGGPIGDRLVVIDGLRPGEWVVTKGAHKVQAGSRVRLLAEQ